MHVSVEMTKATIFDLTCPEEKAFSYFEVINTCEGPGYGDPDKLPSKGPEPEEY